VIGMAIARGPQLLRHGRGLAVTTRAEGYGGGAAGADECQGVPTRVRGRVARGSEARATGLLRSTATTWFAILWIG
jgi:hypothetical protein